MGAKSLIYVGIFVGSTAGSWIGSLFDHGNFFGLWGIVAGTLGGFVGVWAGYKLSQL
ncbi:MAG TPA: hypothetical protein VLF39_00625 [Candidatus Saccharimonadales bacterium]|nr:hypothetical protein [Candidatus Saccharimonadales bacterium]